MIPLFSCSWKAICLGVLRCFYSAHKQKSQQTHEQIMIEISSFKNNNIAELQPVGKAVTCIGQTFKHFCLGTVQKIRPQNWDFILPLLSSQTVRIPVYLLRTSKHQYHGFLISFILSKRRLELMEVCTTYIQNLCKRC